MHMHTHTHTHLSVVDCWRRLWRRSIVAAPQQHLAGLCKRTEGGGSEGGGRQQISVTFGEGGHVANMMIIDDRLRLKC